jgi:hypothetical protein
LRTWTLARRAFLIIKILLVLIVAAWATASVIQTANYTGETGAVENINNTLLATSKGFHTTSAASAAGTSCPGSPVTFGIGTAANTALVNGDEVFEVQVNTTGTTPINTCFTVTLYLSNSTGSETLYGPIKLATGASAPPGETIDCKFDLATASLPSPPFTYRLTIT